MFDLYRDEKGVFTFDDYGTLLAEVRRINPRSVLEFGPGISTLALIEAGCRSIVTLEHDERWALKARELLGGFPIVGIGLYVDAPVVELVDGIGVGPSYDLAYVDSPAGLEARRAVEHPGQEGCSRLNTCLCALKHAPIVLLHDAKRPGEQETLRRLAALGHRVSMIECVKGFARIERGPKC